MHPVPSGSTNQHHRAGGEDVPFETGPVCSSGAPPWLSGRLHFEPMVLDSPDQCLCLNGNYGTGDDYPDLHRLIEVMECRSDDKAVAEQQYAGYVCRTNKYCSGDKARKPPRILEASETIARNAIEKSDGETRRRKETNREHESNWGGCQSFGYRRNAMFKGETDE